MISAEIQNRRDWAANVPEFSAPLCGLLFKELLS